MITSTATPDAPRRTGATVCFSAMSGYNLFRAVVHPARSFRNTEQQLCAVRPLGLAVLHHEMLPNTRSDGVHLSWTRHALVSLNFFSSVCIVQVKGNLASEWLPSQVIGACSFVQALAQNDKWRQL